MHELNLLFYSILLTQYSSGNRIINYLAHISETIGISLIFPCG